MGFFSKLIPGYQKAKLIESKYINLAQTLEETAREEGAAKSGLELAAAILKHIGESERLAKQFVLEELDQIQKIDPHSALINNSGISQSEYSYAKKSDSLVRDERKKLKFLQELIGNVTYHFRDKKLMTQVYINMLELIMMRWKLGKYSDPTQNPLYR